MNTNMRSILKLPDDGSPFVIWEKEKEGEFKRGMILATWVCDNPQCRYVHVEALAVDERFNNMKFNGKEFSYTLESKSQTVEPPILQYLSASVHIDSSEVSIPDDTALEKQDPKLFSWLAKEIKGDLFELLKRRWRMVKKLNRDQWRKKDWSWWEEGVMLGWDEVFPDDPDLIFYSSGKKYWVEDMYCITPGCPCKNVALSFIEIEDKKKSKILGAVTIDLKHLRIGDIKAAEASSETLTRLWGTFQKEPDLKKTLSTREKEMKIIGKEIAKSRSGNMSQDPKPFSKVGRNDPCPCGSGKKYKKCCLDK